MSELDKARIDFITDPNELRFHAENPIEEDGRIHVTPELLFAVADKIDGLRAELARRDLELSVEQAQVKHLDGIITRLKEVLPTLKISHNYCEDCWYSCPKHEDGCCNEAEGEDCNCGADEHNSKIDALMKELE
jgi:hypothetical protein